MKLLLLLIVASTTTLYADINWRKCTTNDLKTLRTAEGPNSQKLKEIILDSIPYLNCSLNETFYNFPMDCGRTIYTHQDFKIEALDYKIKAFVRNESINCRPNSNRAILERVKFIPE